MILSEALIDDLCALEVRIDEKMDQECPADWIVKEDDPIMQAAAWGLDRVKDVKAVARMVSSLVGVKDPLAAISAVDGKTFTSDYVTTYGRRMSAPRALHARGRVVDRLMVKPHERGHVWQHVQMVKGSGWPDFTSHSVLYLAGVLFKTEDGAIYVGKVEGDQYATTEAMRLFLTGNVRPRGEIVETLKAHYNLGGFGPQAAEATLTSHYLTMESGGVPNVWSARVALDVCNQYGRALQGRVIL